MGNQHQLTCLRALRSVRRSTSCTVPPPPSKKHWILLQLPRCRIGDSVPARAGSRPPSNPLLRAQTAMPGPTEPVSRLVQQRQFSSRQGKRWFDASWMRCFIHPSIVVRPTLQSSPPLRGRGREGISIVHSRAFVLHHPTSTYHLESINARCSPYMATSTTAQQALERIQDKDCAVVEGER